jgi:hypothetical protein
MFMGAPTHLAPLLHNQVEKAQDSGETLFRAHPLPTMEELKEIPSAANLFQ